MNVNEKLKISSVSLKVLVNDTFLSLSHSLLCGMLCSKSGKWKFRTFRSAFSHSLDLHCFKLVEHLDKSVTFDSRKFCKWQKKQVEREKLSPRGCIVEGKVLSVNFSLFFASTRSWLWDHENQLYRTLSWCKFAHHREKAARENKLYHQLTILCTCWNIHKCHEEPAAHADYKAHHTRWCIQLQTLTSVRFHSSTLVSWAIIAPFNHSCVDLAVVSPITKLL